ncbi:MAG TPA: class I SAM-dependent methyltransferase [Candidatus Nanoarchaeia archaeon]|nr:class I SAM-dependent methyltransferase [Candidatus Nanoarchaeia archaeon]
MSRNKTAVSFYDLIDSWVGQGIEDFTEGIYNGNPLTPYLEAQRNQHNFILDELHLPQEGGRILEIGCGNGTLLEAAKERRISGVGLTISPIQVKRCNKKGLVVLLQDYRDVTPFHVGSFHGVIANGSLEHFVTPQDAAEGKQDKIYVDLFDRVSSFLGRGQRFVTTAIHYNRIPDPLVVQQNPLSLPWNSDNMHYAFVLGNLGCYYPKQGQLENCAKSKFKLVKEVDGTQDYRITSEHWLSHLWPSCLASVNFWKNLAEKGKRDPKHTLSSLFQYVFTQSWNWQFRPDKYGEAPTRLLRQTWEKI